MRTYLVFAALASFFLADLPSSFAQNGEHNTYRERMQGRMHSRGPQTNMRKPHMNSGGRGDFLKTLNLSEDQKAALKKYRDKREEMKEHQLKVKLKRMELTRLLKNKDTEDGEIWNTVNEMNDTMAEMNKERVKNLLKLKKTLTPDQFEKVVRQTEERMSGNSERGFPGRRGGSGNMGGPNRMGPNRMGQSGRMGQGGPMGGRGGPPGGRAPGAFGGGQPM